VIRISRSRRQRSGDRVGASQSSSGPHERDRIADSDRTRTRDGRIEGEAAAEPPADVTQHFRMVRVIRALRFA
jgi:hypothetical protein